jgi:hypothetical protein
MSEKVIQKIAVIIDFSKNDKMLIACGIKLSALFRTELCLVSRLKKKKLRDKTEKKLEGILKQTDNEAKGLKISTCIIEGPDSKISEKMADLCEIILIITDIKKYKEYSKAVIYSAVPFLFINPQKEGHSFKNIILPVDLRKGISDTALWSSYFGRFNKSTITVIAANHKRVNEQKQVTNNIVRVKKLMQKFKIDHKIYKGIRSSLGNSYEALNFAHISDSDMLVLTGSTTITPLDILIGLPEKKIIGKAGNLSIMLVNARRDNYVLCS